MPVTTIDPQTALIAVDLQKGIVGYPTVHPVAGIVANAAALARAFRARNLPVVLVTVSGGAPGRTEQHRPAAPRPDDWADLVPELDQQASDHTVTKRTWGAFMHTDLGEFLRGRGVTQVVIVGISTSIGVESTARQAFEFGLNVTIASDAVTDTNPLTHENSVLRIFPRLGETGATAEILRLLEGAR